MRRGTDVFILADLREYECRASLEIARAGRPRLHCFSARTAEGGCPYVIRLGLSSLGSAEGFERFHNFGRPLGYFFVSECSLVGLEGRAQQDRIFSGGDGAAAEDFRGREFTQFAEPE